FDAAQSGIHDAGVLRGVQQLPRSDGYEREAVRAAGEEHYRLHDGEVRRDGAGFFENAAALDARSDPRVLALGGGCAATSERAGCSWRGSRGNEPVQRLGETERSGLRGGKRYSDGRRVD